MADVEHHEGRTYRPLGECHFCFDEATWHVTEEDSGEEMLVCGYHKYTAFS